MVAGLGGCAKGVAAEVAGRAGFHRFLVVEGPPDREGQGIVAFGAVLRHRRVAWRLRFRAPGIAVEVARHAGARNRVMVKVDGGEAALEEGRVAGIAGLGRRNVIDGFAHGGGAVVAVRAGLVDQQVIDGGAGEGQRAVAGGAVVRRLDVVGGLAGRGRAVVARRAASDHVAVVDAHVLAVGRDMAVVAAVGRRDVVGGLAACLRSVVAGGAVLGDAAVVKRERPEVAGRVAILAGIADRRVRCRLAGRDAAVVARHAVARRAFRRVVDMAGFAEDLGVASGQRDAANLHMVEAGHRIGAVLGQSGLRHCDQHGQECRENREKPRASCMNGTHRRPSEWPVGHSAISKLPCRLHQFVAHNHVDVTLGSGFPGVNAFAPLYLLWGGV